MRYLCVMLRKVRDGVLFVGEHARFGWIVELLDLVVYSGYCDGDGYRGRVEFFEKYEGGDDLGVVVVE